MIRYCIPALLLASMLCAVKSTFSFAQTATPNSLLNLLPNSSFQNDPLGHHGAPSEWSWSGPAELATIVADKPVQTFGNSFNLDFRTQRSKEWYCWSDYLPINNKKSYLESGWIKTEGNSNGFGANLSRCFYDANKKLIPTSNNQNFTAKHVTPLDWEYYSQILVPQREPVKSTYAEDEIPVNARYIRVGISAVYYHKQAWFNDIRLESYNPASAPLSYGDNKIASMIPVKTDQAISVDGKLDEDIWKSQGQWQSTFVRTVCPENKIAALDQAEQTRFKVAQDKENIYLFIQCNSSDPAAIKSTTTTHNDATLFSDDAVEIFLDPTGERKMPLHLAINPAGAFYEVWGARILNLSLHVAAQKTSNGWQAEVAIPLPSLLQLYREAGSDVDTGLWNINVTRDIPNAGENKYSSWAYTGSHAFLNNENMGFLLLQDPRTILLNRLPDENQYLHQLATQMPTRTGIQAPPQMLALKSTFHSVLQADDEIVQAIKNSTQVSEEDFVRCLLTSRRSKSVLKSTLEKMQRLTLTLPADRKAFGYVIYRTPLFERPTADRIPSNTDFLPKIQLKMAKDEPGQTDFSIFTKVDLNNTQITWGDLKDAQGHVIPRKAVDIRILETWGHDQEADLLATDLRIKLQGWLSNYANQQRFIPLIAHDSSRKMWINVNAGLSTTPGTYSGQIKIQPSNKPATLIPFEITILPFTLPQTKRKVGFIYNGILASPNMPPLGDHSYMFYNGLVTPDECLREFTAIHKAGFTTILPYDCAQGPLDANYSRQLMTIAKQAGFDNVVLIGSQFIIAPTILSDPQQLATNRAILKQRVQEIYKIAGEIGIKKVYIYGFDEPHTKDQYKCDEIIAQVVHECGGQTVEPILYSADYAAIQKNVDVPMMNWLSMTSEPGAVQKYIADRKVGKDITYYANQTNNPTAVSRLTFGWYLYKSGFGGNMVWTYYYLGLYDDPFFEDHNFYGAYYAIPTKEDPIPTLKFEAASAGVTDLRYCEMLNKLIASCKDKTVATNAQKVFNEMLAQVQLENPKGINSPNYLMSPEILEKNRATLQQLILQLLKTQ